MFDSVVVPCPKCGTESRIQSKGGDCNLDVFTISAAPHSVIEDALNEPEKCANCGNWFALINLNSPPPRNRDRPSVTTINLRPIEVYPGNDPVTTWPYNRSLTLDDFADGAWDDAAKSRR